MSFENQILQAIKAVMPPIVGLHTVQEVREFNVRVSWKLNNDPNRLTHKLLSLPPKEGAGVFRLMVAS